MQNKILEALWLQTITLALTLEGLGSSTRRTAPAGCCHSQRSTRSKERERERENGGVMTDGSSPSLPAPPEDTLFSLPQLGFLHPPPPHFRFIPPALPPVRRTDSCASEGDTFNSHPAVYPPQKHTQQVLLLALKILQASIFSLHNTALAGHSF